MCSGTNIRGDYGSYREAFSMVKESVSSSVADLPSLAIRCVEVMNRASILEVRVDFLESAWSSNNTRIGELESQISSKSSELDVATAELESIERLPRFAEDAVGPLRKQIQNQAPQLGKVEVACIAAEVVQVDATSEIQSPTASESALRGEVGQLTRCVRDLGNELARMRQECDSKVEDVHFECDGLQVCLEWTASELLGVRS